MGDAALSQRFNWPEVQALIAALVIPSAMEDAERVRGGEVRGWETTSGSLSGRSKSLTIMQIMRFISEKYGFRYRLRNGVNLKRHGDTAR